MVVVEYIGSSNNKTKSKLMNFINNEDKKNKTEYDLLL